MLPAQHLLAEVVASLRQVIAPAIADPYPRAQAYMAAVILEFIARQVEERRDIAADKQHALDTLFTELEATPAGRALLDAGEPDPEARLGRAIERLYAARQRLDAETFAAYQQRIRATLRALLNAELSVAGPHAP
jgi:hypothetical protein